MANSFAWEKEYKRTWLSDSRSRLKSDIQTEKYSNTQKKKGILRHVHVLIDVSMSIDKNDFLPSFRTSIIKALEKFIDLFYLENPISGLSFSCVNEKTVKSTNNPGIKELLNKQGTGYFSLSNGLYSAIDQLKKYTFCKEVLVITSSLVLKDPDSYKELLETLRKNNIKVNIISMCGEMMIYNMITSYTGGKCYVPVDSDHFGYILRCLTIPGELKSPTTNLIKLGFPRVIYEEGICACHLQLHKEGYECPVCKTYICVLPMACPVCETQMVSSLNISKSFHHMYPLNSFKLRDEGVCGVCSKDAYSFCEECATKYCLECDHFVHENLNFCLGCKGTT